MKIEKNEKYVKLIKTLNKSCNKSNVQSSAMKLAKTIQYYFPSAQNIVAKCCLC